MSTMNAWICVLLCCWGVAIGLAAGNLCPHNDASLVRLSSLSVDFSKEWIVESRVLFDVSSTQFPKGIRIADSGAIVFEPGRSYEVDSAHVLIAGELHAGSEACRFADKLTINLLQGPDVSFDGTDFGCKVIGVAEGGVLSLHGVRGRGVHAWNRLAETALTGATSLRLRRSMEWKAGDELVIASTDFNMNQAEKVRIVSVLDAMIIIDKPLQFMHFGETTYGVDEGAEVGLLTRNILLTTADTGVQGGHVMAVEGFKRVQVAGVQLQNFGQGDRVGRYPLHFHLCGETPPNTYLRDNAIVHSNYRCITVHGTNGVQVQGNVAYDHFGHCMYLEDGVEENNVFERNLVLVTKAKEVRGSGGVGDVGTQHDMLTVSSYWITHPSTVMRDNVAAGSAHTGIWYSFRARSHGLSAYKAQYNNVAPNTVPLADCQGNVIHSAGMNGLFIEPVNQNAALDNDGLQMNVKFPFLQYIPRQSPTDRYISTIYFQNITVYKVRMKGAWFRGVNAVFEHCKFADNEQSLTGASAGGHPDFVGGIVVQDSLFVGWSDNKGQWSPGDPPINPAKGATTPRGPGIAIRGYQFYDGPQSVDRCTFLRFWADDFGSHSAIGNFFHNTWQMGTSNQVLHAYIDERSLPYFNIFREDIPPLRLDGDMNTALADRLGHLSGYKNSYLVLDKPFFTSSRCKSLPSMKASVCPYRYVNVWIENLDTQFARYPRLRNIHETALYLVRDQQEGNSGWQRYEHDLYSIPQFDRWGNKFRAHALGIVGASYSIHFPHRSPRKLRLQLCNAEQGEWVQYALCLPPGASNFAVRRGLFKSNSQTGSMQSATNLRKAYSRTDPDFLQGDAFFYDTSTGMLSVRLVQRFERLEPFNYCPEEGCEQVWITSVIPSDATIGHCGNVAYPAYRVTSGPFFSASLEPRTDTAQSSYLANRQLSHQIKLRQAFSTQSTQDSEPLVAIDTSTDAGIHKSPWDIRPVRTKIPDNKLADQNGFLEGDDQDCGDGVCQGLETCLSCPDDCGNCAFCGDGDCNSGETCENCPQDCSHHLHCRTPRITCRLRPGANEEDICRAVTSTCERMGGMDLADIPCATHVLQYCAHRNDPNSLISQSPSLLRHEANRVFDRYHQLTSICGAVGTCVETLRYPYEDSFTWVQSGWTDCSNGFKQRTIACVDYLGKAVHYSLCTAHPPPKDRQKCKTI